MGTSGTTPLAQAWGEQATTEALRQSLRPPPGALPVPPATDRAAWDLDGGLVHAGTVRQVVDRAEADRGTPWPQPRATLWADYVRTGDRVRYEREVFGRQQRLARAAVAAAATADEAWLDEVADGVVTLCEQSTWCWSAHDDAHGRKGWLVPDVTDPYLDLGAGEVAGQLAWVDHLLGPLLDERVPGLRARVRHEARRRVLDPYLDRRDWWWLGNGRPVNNWNPWICGNVLLAALVLVDGQDEAQLRARLVAQTVADVDVFVATLPADGAVDEGSSYWWEGICRLLEMLDVLQHATGGRLDAAGVPALRESLAFLHRMHLGGGWYLAFADSSPRPTRAQPWDVPHRWAVLLRDEDARRHAAAHRDPAGPVAGEGRGLGRLLRAVADPAWAGAAGEHAEPSGTVWLPSVQVLLTHAATGAHRLSLAVKGGHNGENHNHNDVGSVTVALDGVPVLVDPGRPTYTRQTFGPDRYELWPMQSRWHNVPLVRGSGQGVGARYAASAVGLVDDEPADGRAGLALDLAGAYGREDVRSWRRRAVLDGEVVTVTDAWDLAPAPRAGGDGDPDDDGPTRLHWMVAGTVRLTGAGRAEVEPLEGDGRLVLTWEPALEATVEAKDLDDPYLVEPWGPRLTRLALDADVGPEGGQGSCALRVEVR
ncbi:heparinase II/III domain-containing protein [Georgenia alba]|uniref:Heparinase II/III family protein n=1 Tax=Georgenia alba TaxID=2233858 RepID=A0ABW2QBC9_9MICO